MIIAYVALVSKVTDPWNPSGWAAPIHRLASSEMVLLPKHHPVRVRALLREGSVRAAIAREVPSREVPARSGRAHEERDWGTRSDSSRRASHGDHWRNSRIELKCWPGGLIGSAIVTYSIEKCEFSVIGL